MKLRIKGNSIRLRLTQSEVRQLGTDGGVSEALHVGAAAPFVYSVEVGDVDALTAERVPDRLTVFVPREWAHDWYDSDTVGFSCDGIAGASPTPSILVEKDFACLDERLDEVDAFPNPNASAC